MLAGIGAYGLQAVGGYPSPYGRTGALQAGAGIDGNFWRRVDPFVEARVIVHLTDYGSDLGDPTVYFPILFGLRIR